MTLASVDPFLARRRRHGYDCRHLLRDAWLAHTGEDLGDRFPALLATGTVDRRTIAGARRLPAPIDPCIVVMRDKGGSHLGMFLRGGVLHLARATARFERLDLAATGFSEIRFYT